jgi:monovalent cation:H+ antiporter-2, CPA2 family
MELTILRDIVIIFALSTFVNLLFTRLNIPTVVGYLLTGMVAGPYFMGFVGEVENIEVLANIGVIFLLFTLGIELSLKQLVKIRKTVFLGGFLQVFITAGIFYLLSVLYNMSWRSSIIIGFLAAISSTTLILKVLQERSETSSNYGQTVLGVSIFQDLLLVPLLLLTSILGNPDIELKNELFLILLKAMGIISFVYIGNRWLFPWILHIVALTRNQELFIMTIMLICFSVALLTFKMGMSLAFGAFLAGLMISDSEYSHNTFGNFIPFKDIFVSFFFVSIGMLLNLAFVVENPVLVAVSVLLVVSLKFLIASGVGFILGHTFRGIIIIGIALSQVGEFSFILAKEGFDYNILSSHQYQLFLAVTVITMAIMPFMMKMSIPLANWFLQYPLPDFLVKGIFPLKEAAIPKYKNHLVIIGKDSSALKLSIMAKHYNLRHVSIIFDPVVARDKVNAGDAVVYGDAVNDPILIKAHVDLADVIVISVGSVIPSMAILEKVKRMNSRAFVIVRAQTIDHIQQFYDLGADQVYPEKLEIAIDFFHRILMKKLYPQKEINRMLAHIRSMNLGDLTEKDMVNQPTLFDQMPNVNIAAITIDENSLAAGKTLGELDLRKKTGVTLLAVKRKDIMIDHPTLRTKFQENDIVYILGNPEQVNLASELFSV